MYALIPATAIRPTRVWEAARAPHTKSAIRLATPSPEESRHAKLEAKPTAGIASQRPPPDEMEPPPAGEDDRRGCQEGDPQPDIESGGSGSEQAVAQDAQHEGRDQDAETEPRLLIHY